MLKILLGVMVMVTYLTGAFASRYNTKKFKISTDKCVESILSGVDFSRENVERNLNFLFKSNEENVEKNFSQYLPPSNLDDFNNYVISQISSASLTSFSQVCGNIFNGVEDEPLIKKVEAYMLLEAVTKDVIFHLSKSQDKESLNPTEPLSFSLKAVFREYAPRYKKIFQPDEETSSLV